jgi:hypothetical protein
MYDHNQTLLPESFLALYVRNGRPVVDRNELEARYEIAETIALHIAEVIARIPNDDENGQRESLQSVKASLLTAPAPVSEAEATWVITRVAEICEWKPPRL